jgi:hypothetical protein
MHRIEHLRRERLVLQAATLAARLRQRLRRSPDDAGLRRLVALLESTRPPPSLPLPGLPRGRAEGRSD